MSPQGLTPPANWTKCSNRSSRCCERVAWGLGAAGAWGRTVARLSVTSRKAGVTPFGETVNKQFLYLQEH